MRKTDRRGVRALLASSAAIFWPGALAFGFPGVMAPYWQRMFHCGKGAMGNTLFFGLASLGIFMFFVGRWQERFGMRKMITVGTVLLALNMFTVAFASNLSMLYLWSFINGASTCFIYTPAMTTVQRWFTQRRGLASGVINFTFGISAAITSPLFHHMITSLGYVKMNLVVAAVTALVGIAAAPFIETPEPMAAGSSAGAPARAAVTTSLTVRETIATKSFWFLWLTWAFQGAAGIAMVSLATIFGLSKGYAMESAIMILTAFNAMNGAGRILMGYLSDMLDRSLAMSATFFAAGVAYLVLPHISGVVGTALLAAVIGLSFGTLFVVSAPLAAECFGIAHFGAILGLVFTAYGFFAGLLGPSLSGYILDITGGNFTLVFSYLGAFCLLSSGLIRFVAPPQAESTVLAGPLPAVQPDNPV